LPYVAKIDCLFTDDLRRYKKEDIPVKVGIAGDMCPDHFAIYNTDNILEWGKKADVLLLETAGLCLRCAPYTDDCFAVCVIDITTGPYTPQKIGPLLTTADLAVMTKGDLVSQAEREVFRQKIIEVNPKCKIIEANGLNGLGAGEITDIICESEKRKGGEAELRHTAPMAVCTLCTGETRVGKKHHFGLLRQTDGGISYEGE
jgi:Ni2+-binding GTPase involved in maturation of urease and hydrogenase